MFSTLHPIHRLHRLRRLDSLQRVVGLADRMPRRAIGRIGFRKRRTPPVGLLLVAGAAVLAFAWLMSASSRPQRSRVRQLLLTGLLVAVGLIVLSLRRSAHRYRW